MVVAGQGCQVLDGFDEDATADQQSSIAITQLPVDPAYPKLSTVPPRPQLSYSVEQHREIVERLIGDREHARYTSRQIRYRAGLSSLPPPPRPEPDDEARAIARAVVGDGQPAATQPRAPRADVPSAAYGDVTDPGVANDGDLGDFIREMVEETAPAAPATAEPSPGDDPAPPDADDPSDPDASDDMSKAPAARSSARPSGEPSATPLFAWIDEAAGRDPSIGPEGGAPKALEASLQADAAPVAAAALPPPTGTEEQVTPAVELAAADAATAKIPAAQRSDALAARAGAPSPSPVARPKLRPDPETGSGPGAEPAPAPAAPPPEGATSLVTLRFADGSAELPADATSRLRAALASLKGDGPIEIVARGEAMTLALDRARAVALGLMRLGAGAGDLEIAAEAVPGANDVRVRVGERPAGD